MNIPYEITVIVTTRDRSARLHKMLASLQAQTIERERWELIVVDNGSRDDTSEVLAAASAALPMHILSIAEPGKCRAQNQAIDRAQGAVVVFTDDDVSCDPQWLEAMAAVARRWPAASLFGGTIRLAHPSAEAVPEWLRGAAGQEIISRHCAAYAPRSDEGPTEEPPIGPNMAIRREALVANRFDERLGPDGTADYVKGGDTELGRRLLGQGYLCVYAPAAVVEHWIHAEQLTHERLFAGIYRRGRRNGSFENRHRGLRIAGVPPRLWLRLSRQWLRYRLAGRDPLKRYRAGAKYHFRRGVIQELRNRRRSTNC